MIFDWLIPPVYQGDGDFLKLLHYYDGNALSPADLQEYDLFMLGIAMESGVIPDGIRKQLEPKSAAFFKDFKIFDLGNLMLHRQEKKEGFLRYFLTELKNYVANRNLILFTDNWPLVASLLLEMYGTESSQISIVDASLETDEIQFLSDKKLKTIHLLGIQNYLITTEAKKLIQKHAAKIHLKRLSEISSGIEAEPAIRESDLMVFKPTSLAFSDAGSNPPARPIGLRASQWASMGYYAGISPVNRHLIFQVPEQEEKTIGAFNEIIAITLWHYVWGMYNNLPDYPFIEKKQLTEVIIRKGNQKMKFYTNPLTGRWWKEEKNRLIPCTKEEFVKSKDENFV